MKRLVVTADDLGLHPAIDRGVLRAHDEGIVTAVSVVSVGRSFVDAVARLRERPDLDVGAHLTLVGERPLSAPGEVPSLLGRGGALLPAWPAFLRRYVRGAIRLDEVERELRRQLERLLATGLPVVHLNSHQHLHALPGIFALVLRLARQHGVPFVRVPVAGTAAAGAGVARRAQLAALGWLGRRASRRLVGTPGVGAIAQTLGLAEAGRLTVEGLERSIATVAGTAELVCHPGTDDPALAATYRWGYAWERETAALCAPSVRAALGAAGVELARFRRLP